MRRREVLTLLTGAAALRPSTARLQPTRKLPRVGFLGATSASGHASQIAALLSGLRELGYIDGTNIRIEFRWAEGNYDLLPQLAAEYEHLKVDVLVTHGTPGTLAAKAASKTIPIVAAAIGDPVTTGVVTSIAQPGGNITGVMAKPLKLTRPNNSNREPIGTVLVAAKKTAVSAEEGANRTSTSARTSSAASSGS